MSRFLAVTLKKVINLSIPSDFRDTQYSEFQHDHSRTYRGIINCHKCNLPYAVVIYEKSEARLDCNGGTTDEAVWAFFKKDKNTLLFDSVSAGGSGSDGEQLRIYFYTPSTVPSGKIADLPLGSATIQPFGPNGILGLNGGGDDQLDQWVSLDQGGGQVLIDLKYLSEEQTNAIIGSQSDKYKDGIDNISGHLEVITVGAITGQAYVDKVIVENGSQQQLQQHVNLQAGKLQNHFIAPISSQYIRDDRLYIRSPFIGGGHLFLHIQTRQRLTVDATKFYAAELICAIQFLHSKEIFGWLKTRTVMLDAAGHICLCGFRPYISTGKDDNYKYNLYGRAEYPAPEILAGQSPSKAAAADWWTLGNFIYEMLTGIPPFYRRDFVDGETNMRYGPITFPDSVSVVAQDLILRLLEFSPDKRLGSSLNGAVEIQSHRLFHDINWERVNLRQDTPPFRSSRSILTELVHYPAERPPVPHMFSGLLNLIRRSRGGRTDNFDKKDIPEDALWAGLLLKRTVYEGNFRFTRLLLEHGISCNIKWDHHWLNIDLIQTNFSYDCDFDSIDTLPLISAIQWGDLSLVELLLSYGADPNSVEHGSSGCHSCIQVAVTEGHDEIIRLLLSYGADIHRPFETWVTVGHQCRLVPRWVHQRVVSLRF